MKVSATNLKCVLDMLPPVKAYFYNPTVSIPVSGCYDMCHPRAGIQEEIKFSRVQGPEGFEWALEIDNKEQELKRLIEQKESIEKKYISEHIRHDEQRRNNSELKDELSATFWRMLGAGLIVGGAFGMLIMWIILHAK